MHAVKATSVAMRNQADRLVDGRLGATLLLIAQPSHSLKRVRKQLHRA